MTTNLIEQLEKAEVVEIEIIKSLSDIHNQGIGGPFCNDAYEIACERLRAIRLHIAALRAMGDDDEG